MARKGKNKDKCKAYSQMGTREKNKKRKLQRHVNNIRNRMERRPHLKPDLVAEKALELV